MTDMTEANGQPLLTDVRAAHLLDEDRLKDWLRAHVAGDFSHLDIRQFEVGQSNPTYLLDNGTRRFVLRKQPSGPLLPSAHRVDREFRVQRALADTEVPVPEVLALCQDPDVLGTDFYVMEHLEGRVFDDPRLLSLPADDVRAIYKDFARVLGTLHSQDFEEIGLGTFGRHSGYYRRQVDLWTEQYRLTATRDIPEMDALIAWLDKNIPDDDEGAIVHGDYRMGNCILHPTEPRIIGLLDWELSTIGHPLADVAYACLGYHGAISTEHFLDVDFEATGLPTEEAFLADYCHYAGRDGIENWTFHIAFSAFRSAGILQGVYKRSLQGNASSDHASRFEHSAAEISTWAIRLIEEARDR